MPDLELPAALARRLREAGARAGRCRILAIDGPSGSGKSTLAQAVAAELAAQVVEVDQLIPGWGGLRAGPAIVLRDVVQPIARGSDGGYRRYDWVAGQYAEWCPVPRAEHLVVEGCGAGDLSLAPYLSLLVWVEADLELRFERGLARDGETFRPHWVAWERETAALFAEQRTHARADLEVDGARTWPPGPPGPPGPGQEG